MLIRSGAHYGESGLMMVVKLSMDIFNYILLRDKSNKCWMDIVVLLDKLIYMTIMDILIFSVLLKENLVKPYHRFTLVRYLLLLLEPRNSKKRLKSFTMVNIKMTSLYTCMSPINMVYYT
jgi:hypothetical protein